MDIYNVEFTLTMIAIAAVAISISIYLGSWILYSIRVPETPVTQRLIASKPSNTASNRRRVEHWPGVICSLPIHQQAARHEAIPSIT